MEHGLISIDSDSVLRLVQITDTHLYAGAEQQLLGINTRASFLSVVELVRQQRQQIDALLLSGDLSQDDSLGAYQFLHETLAPFAVPQCWYKGNHDDKIPMWQVAKPHDYLNTLIRTPHWQVVILDSQVEGAVLGYLPEEQLDYLRLCLEEAPQLHTLVSFHHHPIPMDSLWMDRIGLKNANEFQQLIAQYENVRGVLWGHVHQDSDRTVDGVRYLSTPSTCVQFKPKSEDFAVDTAAPGYRWLDLHADGRIDTAVERVAAGLFMPDITSNGY